MSEKYRPRHAHPATVTPRSRLLAVLSGMVAAGLVTLLAGLSLLPTGAVASSPAGDTWVHGAEVVYRDNYCTARAGSTLRANAAAQLKQIALYRGVAYVAPVCPSPSSSPSSPAPSPSTSTPAPSPSTSSPAPTTPAPSPTGSPTPTATGTPTPGPVQLDCMRQADRCGWPTTATAGVPADIKATLPQPSGPPNSSPILLGDNAVLERVVTNRCYKVVGDNVRIQYVVFRPVDCGPAVIDAEDGPYEGIVIDHVELDLSLMCDWDGCGYPHNFNVRAISGDGFTWSNSYCHSGGDCVHYGGDVVIRDNLVDIPECSLLPACSSMHIDGLHSASGHQDPAKRHVLIQHNTIIMRGTGDGHPNAAIINGPDIGPYAYPQGTVIIRENLMAGGGAVTYCSAHVEDTPDHTAEIWGNRISDLVWPRGGKWGPFYDDCMNPPAPGRLTNVWDRTGETIELGSWA